MRKHSKVFWITRDYRSACYYAWNCKPRWVKNIKQWAYGDCLTGLCSGDIERHLTTKLIGGPKSIMKVRLEVLK